MGRPTRLPLSTDGKILRQLEAQTALLERIADTLDTVAMGQDAAQQTLEELADFILADEEPPVVAKGEYPLPGFDGDPLAKFPSIRKEEDGK